MRSSLARLPRFAYSLLMVSALRPSFELRSPATLKGSPAGLARRLIALDLLLRLAR
jgi:hypothetical protein